MSFGSVAGSYDRVRPEPPRQALDWLVPAGCEVAVDLAAGTGLFTRALLGRAARVVAVEPDERMRGVLARRSPGVDVRAGQGDLLRTPGAGAAGTGSDAPRAAAQVRARLDRHHTVTLPAGAAFGSQEAASFYFTRTISTGDVLEWLATSSEFITAPAADRTAGLARCRTALAARADRAGVLTMPMRSWCWRAQRWLPSGTSNDENESAVGCQVTVSPTISVWDRTTAEHTATGLGVPPGRRSTAPLITKSRPYTGPTARIRPGHSAGPAASQ